MPSLNRYEKVTCENCGTQTTKLNRARHKKSCSAGTLHCSQCPNFFTKSQNALNYHIAKKHSIPKPDITFKCKLCYAEFPGFYALRQHKNTQHGPQMGFGATNIDVEDIVGDVDDQSLREELESCKHFLTDTEMENGRHRVFNFAMSSFNMSLLNDKLDYVFKELKCAAKVNLAFGFVLKNIEDGMCRYFYAHENNTIMETSKLVCTQADMTTLKDRMQKMDIVDICTRERANTKWKFYKLTNLTIFASLLKDVPMGCKDTVLPEPLLRNRNVNCLYFERNTSQPYNDNLCLFRASALHLHGNEKLEEETSKIFNLFLNNSEERDPSKFQGVHMTDIPKVEEMLQLNIFLYDIDFEDGELIGELARRSIQKFEKSVKLLRYNNHICYVNNINAFFKAFRCTTCDTFFSKTGNLERHLVTCSDRVKHIYPKNVYELRETLFEKLDAFNIPYRSEQKLFKNLAIFDFESICVKEANSYKQTETTTWIGKHVPISVSISSNLIPEPIFLCNANPHHLISSFITALEGLATQSKAQMKLNFIEIETAIKTKLYPVLEQLNQRRNRVSNFVDDCIVEEEEKDSSTQFLQMQKNQLIDLQEHFERYCNVLPVFGFNSANYDINLIKSYLLPILVNERDIEPTVIKKANQFVSFKFGDIQLLEIMNFLGGATSLDSFLKAYKTKETKGFFPYEWFDCPEKINNKELPPYDSFFNILRNSNPLEKDYNDFQNLVNSGLTTEQAVAKLRMHRIPPTGAENYSYLQSVWESNNMQNFSDFLKWYNNKDVVPTLEAMQKMIEFYHYKGIDMLKLGCTLPNLANICLHKSTDSKFYPFTESDKDLLEKIREDMVGGPSIVFTRKAVVDETFIRKSSNLCKSIIGIDASQLYPYSMCQPMPTGLYTQWEYDSETNRFTARQNKSRSFENMVLSYFQQSHPDCKIESNVTTGRQEKIACFSVDGICYHCNTVFEAMGCYYHYCPCQEARPSLTDTDIERGVKKRQQDEMRRDYIQQKGYQIVEMWECEWWSLYKTDASVKSHLRKNFPYRRPLSEEGLLHGIIDGKLFGYVQCDIEVPEHLRDYFSNFPPIFKNTAVSRDDIGNLMKQ